VTGRHGAAAQAGQRVRLVPGAGDGAGQVQGTLVRPLSLREVTADPVQCPSLVERLGLASPVAEVAEDAQRLLQGLGRGRVITRQAPDGPEVEEGADLAQPVVGTECVIEFLRLARLDQANGAAFRSGESASLNACPRRLSCLKCAASMPATAAKQ
jgi:hypothetical protein